MKTPPLLPSEVVIRIIRVARVNGTGVLVIAGAFALMSAADHQVMPALLGLLVALSGAAEIHGAGNIARGRADGVGWLVGSQIFLLLVILGYCGYRLAFPDMTELREFVNGDLNTQMAQSGMDFKTKMAESGLTVEEGIKALYSFWYTTIAISTVIYQGLMARYYAKRRGAVEIALGQDDLGLHG